MSCTTSCSKQLAVGTAVHLDATPASGMQFMGWSGACSGTGSCDLTLGSDTRVGATLAGGTVTLTVDPVGDGSGVVTSSPPGISCPATCAMQVAPGTPVTLTATANAGSHFEGYGGSGCSGLSCAFTVTSGVTVFANFTSLGAGPAQRRSPAEGRRSALRRQGSRRRATSASCSEGRATQSCRTGPLPPPSTSSNRPARRAER